MGYVKCSEKTPKKPWGFNHGVRVDTGSIDLSWGWWTAVKMVFVHEGAAAHDQYCEHFGGSKN